MKNKKGISAIVTVMILILIVSLGTLVIWKVISKTIDKGLKESKSCYDLIGMVNINSKYTCYDATNNEMFISVEIGDVVINGLFIILDYEESAVSFELTNESKLVPQLLNYTRDNQIKIPNKNAGATYIATGIAEQPNSIGIAPVVDENLCEEIRFTNIGSC